jgi:hypothetical protein
MALSEVRDAGQTRGEILREATGTATSDSALLTLLDRIKSASDPEEIRELATQIERVVFHKA